MDDKKRMNVEDDRLSSFPTEVIQKIFSYISIKQAVESSILSSRFRNIWTSMPVLNLSANDFRTLPSIPKFVNHLLSNRNNESDVISVNLTIRGKVWQKFVESILNYAYSHDVQQLNITGLPGNVYQFPPSLFCSQSLKQLTLTGDIDIMNLPNGAMPALTTLNLHHVSFDLMTIPTEAMPSLTTLNLNRVTFYNNKCADDLFTNFPNLKNLTLKHCMTLNSFIIRHPGLSSLTLEFGREVVNVVTPQLKNLTIKYWRGIHLVSAPNLISLGYTDHYFTYKDNDGGPLQLSTDLLHLEKVDICIDSHALEDKAYTHRILCLLQQFRSVKFLTLSLELVKFLSSMEVISHQTSPFVNLKSLKVYPVFVPPKAQEKVTMSDEVKNFLLGGSPSATFTMDIPAVKSVTSARNLVSELEQDMNMKEYFETYISDILSPMGIRVATELKIEAMFSRMIALLKMVPTSRLGTLQSRFYGMCSEAKGLLKKQMHS